jgi:cytochrome c-type biogenesis protein CcmH/NrfG
VVGIYLCYAQNYREAAAAFTEALKLDPENYEIKIALR